MTKWIRKYYFGITVKFYNIQCWWSLVGPDIFASTWREPVVNKVNIEESIAEKMKEMFDDTLHPAFF